MKTATAQTHLEVWVDCPHCDGYQNILDKVQEDIGHDLRAEDLDTEITCEDCGEVFIVDEITF